MTEIELLEILKTGEGVDIECKEGSGDVPKSLWESYSAMANTNGGIIILGIKEIQKEERFEVQGVKNVDKRIKDFWNTINSSKVNKNLLLDEDVQKKSINGMDIILINIPRADYREKPIFINDNPYRGTYKRNAEGDYRCTQSEVNAMIRDATDEGNDGTIIEGYILEDLDPDTIKRYRNRFSSRQPEHPWNEYDNKEFLRMLGAIKEDRRKKLEGITVAGLLMFGKGLYIRDLYSHINMDYREEIDVDEDMRWSDRLTIDGTWENNLYNFYVSVIGKLTQNLRVPFKLENLERKDDTPVHQAIREAFANMIIHSDFNIQGTLKIIKCKDSFEFTNPGTLKIDVDIIFKGGDSKSRNPKIQNMFMMIGLGEKAGSGFPKILSAWNEQHWRTPELNEDLKLGQVSLKLWMISMIPDDCINKLEEFFGSQVKSLSKDELLVLSTAEIEGSVNNARVQQMVDKHSYDISKILNSLVQRKLLIVEGYGRGKVYYLNREFNSKEKEITKTDFSEDELKIIDYLKENGKINNTKARDDLNLTRDRSIRAFNSLIQKKELERVGKGRGTYYVLKQ